MFGLAELFSIFLGFLTKPEFRRLATSIDYIQLVSYNDKDDLVIVLGHNPTQETRTRYGLQFLLAVRKMAPEGIIEPFDGGTSFTYFVRKDTKEKIKEALM